eukprot:11928926-Alexandrium_andersonii.AAC.1
MAALAARSRAALSGEGARTRLLSRDTIAKILTCVCVACSGVWGVCDIASAPTPAGSGTADELSLIHI